MPDILPGDATRAPRPTLALAVTDDALRISDEAEEGQDIDRLVQQMKSDIKESLDVFLNLSISQSLSLCS